ncbi:MAG TPA: DUF4388 domain-containing protein [Candidatus Dormibacteraeota bacterium]
MQSNGTLNDTNVRNLLETAQSERATGTLTVRNGNGSACTLYFLFGHLFHAVGEGAAGDDAVVKALKWQTGDFEFDAKAKLPADETVRGSIGDLVSIADQAPSEGRHEGAPAEAPAPPPEPEPAPETKASEPEPEPAPRPVEAPEPEPPSPRRGVKHRPTPKHGREPVPVPAGQVTYDSLKTSFVDFPRLITTLERESYTGYIRLLTEEAAGLILFREGSALECAYDIGADPKLALGTDALTQFNEAVNDGQGVLDVVSLSPELVDGLHELTVASPLYSELYAAWVDPSALLKFLEKRKLSGSLMVRSAKGTGVIILTEGKLTGAYTSDSRDISDAPDGVLELCQDEEAVIEVKSAENSKREPLDVDAIVGSRKIPTGTTQTAMPVYRPEAESAAPAEPAPEPAPPPPAVVPPSQSAGVWETTAVPEASAGSTQQNLPVQNLEPSPGPAPEPAPAPAGAANSNVDWEAVITELQTLTEDALGNRARKVKDVLASADRSEAGVEAAIDQIPSISILFVDSSRLEGLASELRGRLRNHLS